MLVRWWDARAWLNGPHSKCGIPARVSGVRIPLPPPIKIMKRLSINQLNDEFQRQVKDLLLLGYPSMMKISEEELLGHILPLKEKLADLDVAEANFEQGYLPFVIVVKNKMVDSEEIMSRTTKNNKSGVTILRPLTAKDFKTIESITIPEDIAYLLTHIDRGRENINLPPKEAMVIIQKAGRTPLTIDEGIAVLTHYPEFLIKNNCFSLLASRTGTDQRVPAIWINAKKEANLGWCWNGNPHTWLGSASALKRLSAN